MRACLIIVRRVRKGGLAFFAPLCSLAPSIVIHCAINLVNLVLLYMCVPSSGSSFCYLNKGTSGRHGVLLPQGLSSEPSVRIANLIANRTMMLVEAALCLGQVPCVEQPQHPHGLFSLKRWQSMLERQRWYRASCKQGAYSADTVKPTFIFSVHNRFQHLKNDISTSDKQRMHDIGKELVTKKRDAKGVVKVTGKPQALKSTQTYTNAFGVAIVGSCQQRCVSWRHHSDQLCIADETCCRA